MFSIIKVNGKNYLLAKHKHVNLKYCLIFLGVNCNIIALEHNKELIRKEDFLKAECLHNDNVEILSIVGGG
jgi:thiamine biosynthesis protein ThiS